MTGLLRPQDLKQIASDAEIAKMDDELKHRKRTDQLKEELLEASPPNRAASGWKC